MAYLSSIARSGVVSLIAITSLAATPSYAAPIGPILNPNLSESSKPLPIAMGEGRGHGPGYQIWPRMGGRGWNGGGWNGGGRYWNGGGRWNGHGRWNCGWRGGGWGGGWGGWGNGWGGWGPGFALGLGLGLPLGYLGGGYYGGGYYDEPVYRPRYNRVYRGRRRTCRMVLQPLPVVPGMGQ